MLVVCLSQQVLDCCDLDVERFVETRGIADQPCFWLHEGWSLLVPAGWSPVVVSIDARGQTVEGEGEQQPLQSAAYTTHALFSQQIMKNIRDKTRIDMFSGATRCQRAVCRVAVGCELSRKVATGYGERQVLRLSLFRECTDCLLNEASRTGSGARGFALAPIPSLSQCSHKLSIAVDNGITSAVVCVRFETFRGGIRNDGVV